MAAYSLSNFDRGVVQSLDFGRCTGLNVKGCSCQRQSYCGPHKALSGSYLGGQSLVQGLKPRRQQIAHSREIHIRQPDRPDQKTLDGHNVN